MASAENQLWFETLVQKFKDSEVPEFDFLYFEKSSSTMELAKTWVHESLSADLEQHVNASESALGPLSAVILADEQSAGRGRGSNDWISESGRGLYFSALIANDACVEDLRGYSLALGVAVHKALKSIGIEAKLKWPNDILIGQNDSFSKIGGILVEVIRGSSEDEYLSVGLGINLEASEQVKAIGGIGISDLVQADEDTLADFFVRLVSQINSVSMDFFIDGFSAFAEYWNRCSIMTGAKLKIQDKDGERLVTSVGIQHDGGLVVETPGEALKREVLYGGQVELLSVAGN